MERQNMSSNPHFIFDIDNTICPPRQPMSKDFGLFFVEFLNRYKVHLISGSDIDKIKQQVPLYILRNVYSVHACSGNQIWEPLDGELICITERKWWPGTDLLDELSSILDESYYPFRYGNHIEARVGTYNFSVCGRNGTLQERNHYRDWDLINQERSYLVNSLRRDYKDLEFDIGGEISIDIYPKGKNKSQIIDYLREKYPKDLSNRRKSVIFFGDKCYDGNDKCLVNRILEERIGDFHNVGGPDDTLRILREIT